MPQLHKLVWNANRATILFIQLFLHPGLAELSLVVPLSPLPIQDLAAILPYVEHRSKSLVSLSVRGLENINSELHPVMSSFVGSFMGLRKYNGPVILSRNDVLHLSQLPALEEVSFITSFSPVDPLWTNELRDTVEPPFPSLRRMSASFLGSTDQVTSFLSALQRSSHTREDIRIACDDPFPNQLQAWIKEISQVAESNPLTKLCFTFPCQRRSVRPQTLGQINLSFALSTFHPLYTQGLTHLHITSFYLVVDDTSLGRLASALPNLRSLMLLPGMHDRNSVVVTFNGLVSLIHTCPLLESLGLAFDSTVKLHQLPEHLHPASRRNNRLHTLKVADSPILHSGIDLVALVLSGLFGNPRIAIVSGDFVLRNRPQQEVTLCTERLRDWGEVSKLVKCLIAARMSERSGSIVDPQILAADFLRV